MEPIEKAIAQLKARIPGRRKPVQSAYAHSKPYDPEPELKTARVSLSHNQLEAHHIVTHNKSDPRGVSYDQLRTHVQQAMLEGGWRTLAITSPSPGCGKTVTALNLAFSLSHLPDQHVMLADFDLRRPKVATLLGLERRPGFSDYIAGEAAIEETFISPKVADIAAERLVIMPSFAPIEGSSEILGAEQTQTLVESMRERYHDRLLLFDLPPVLTSDDVLAFLPSVDAVLLVVASGKTTNGEVESAARLLARHHMLGAVLNFADQIPNDYY